MAVFSSWHPHSTSATFPIYWFCFFFWFLSAESTYLPYFCFQVFFHILFFGRFHSLHFAAGHLAINGTLACLLLTLPLMSVPVGIFVALCKVSDFYFQAFPSPPLHSASLHLSATLPVCRTWTPWPPRRAICASLGCTCPSSPCANASSAERQGSLAGRTAKVKTWRWMRKQGKTDGVEGPEWKFRVENRSSSILVDYSLHITSRWFTAFSAKDTENFFILILYIQVFYISLVIKSTNKFQDIVVFCYIYFNKCIVKLCWAPLHFITWNIWCNIYIYNNCNSCFIFQCLIVSVETAIINVSFFKMSVHGKHFWTFQNQSGNICVGRLRVRKPIHCSSMAPSSGGK